VGRFVPEI